ncbi:MAG: cysteine--tRNA ligase [Candidatus Kaelpia imicola]|nr:cysteine--tRNA ligase [Candidatus Kaelpia imicola]
MAIKLLNSLSKKKEEFQPIRENKVSIYLCGPTVYDKPHLGHLRSAYDFDVIRKYFLFSGYEVLFLRNVTDIDDKIIDKARSSSSKDLKESTREIADKYYKVYDLWMTQFGIMPPDLEPWATDHISQMQEMIQELIDRDCAYLSDGDVYFDIKKFKNYGKLSHRSAEDMISGVRVEPGDKKRDSLDFALWKKAKEGEPSWESPWGKGRPGWHIECSAMSTCYLGNTFDIHAGGRDLIFPHHENEIAQAEAATGKRFANYWLHNGMLTIDAQKMAKSLGNFIAIEDVLSKYHPDVVKMFFLSTNYSSPIDFSWQRLDGLKSVKSSFDSFFSKLRVIRNVEYLKSEVKFGKEYSEFDNQIDGLASKFKDAMDDNFNTALAFGVLNEMLSLGNKIYDDKNIEFSSKVILLIRIKNLVLKFSKIFGLFENLDSGIEGYKQAVDILVRIRDELRDQKLYQLADKIRGSLENIGIVLEDGAGGSSWRKV